MSEAIKAMDAARLGPHVTCPVSRHAAMMAEAMITGKPYPMMDEERAYCGESIAATVEALWRARAALREIRAGISLINHDGATDDVLLTCGALTAKINKALGVEAKS